MHPTNEPVPMRHHGRPLSLPPTHHLWRNGHRWWIAVVLTDPLGRTRRVRRSLGTRDLDEARLRRDALLARLALSRHWRLPPTLAASA
jgi:hypothetical protein